MVVTAWGLVEICISGLSGTLQEEVSSDRKDVYCTFDGIEPQKLVTIQVTNEAVVQHPFTRPVKLLNLHYLGVPTS